MLSLNQNGGSGSGMRHTRNTPGTRAGALVISLDLELHWGVRDHTPLRRFERQRLLSARRAVPCLLKLFEEFEIHATWATVGFLLARSKEELKAFLPTTRPSYAIRSLDPYQELIGSNEAEDPFHFAPSLIQRIGQSPGQEIASHSFSHYYCMEDGQSVDSFRADLESAIAIARRSGFETHSYVFPRNQANPKYLRVLEAAGVRSYRDTEAAAVKKPTSFRAQRGAHRRLGRFLDSYCDLFGHQTHEWISGRGLVPVSASRYLSPYRPLLRTAEIARYRRISEAMMYAAEQGEIFHLWFHPEDFALNSTENFQFLRSILQCFNDLRQRFAMRSLSMIEAATADQKLLNTEAYSGGVCMESRR